jgi:hypothetical protein
MKAQSFFHLQFKVIRNFLRRGLNRPKCIVSIFRIGLLINNATSLFSKSKILIEMTNRIRKVSALTFFVNEVRFSIISFIRSVEVLSCHFVLVLLLYQRLFVFKLISDIVRSSIPYAVPLNEHFFNFNLSLRTYRVTKHQWSKHFICIHHSHWQWRVSSMSQMMLCTSRRKIVVDWEVHSVMTRFFTLRFIVKRVFLTEWVFVWLATTSLI